MKKLIIALVTVIALGTGGYYGYRYITAPNIATRQIDKDLLEAVRSNDSKKVQVFIDSGADIEVVNKNERTPLHIAAMKGNIEIIKLLLKNGAEINAKDIVNYTPIMQATFNGHLNCANFLMNQGADIHTLSSIDDNLIQLALSEYHTKDKKMAEALIKALIKKGIDVNTVSESGSSALSSAISYNNEEMIKLLLSKGASINAINPKTHNTALLSITKWHKVDINILRRILEMGADPNMKNKDGVTPLLRVVGKYDSTLDLVKLLVEYQADINAKANNGYTILDFARDAKKLSLNDEIVKYLENLGAKSSTKYNNQNKAQKAQ